MHGRVAAAAIQAVMPTVKPTHKRRAHVKDKDSIVVPCGCVLHALSYGAPIPGAADAPPGPIP